METAIRIKKTPTKERFDSLQLELSAKIGKRLNQDNMMTILSLSFEQIMEKCKTVGDLRKLTEEYLNA